MKESRRQKLIRFINEENVQELVLTSKEIMSLIVILSTHASEIDFDKQCLVMHYLPMKGKRKSALLTGVRLDRLGSLLHVQVTELDSSIEGINLDDELERVAKWLDILDN